MSEEQTTVQEEETQDDGPTETTDRSDTENTPDDAPVDSGSTDMDDESSEGADPEDGEADGEQDAGEEDSDGGEEGLQDDDSGEEGTDVPEGDAEAEELEASWDDIRGANDAPEMEGVINGLEEAGVSVNDAYKAFGEAIRTGDPDKLDFAALGPKVSTANLPLYKMAMEKVVKDIKQNADNLQKYAYEAAGSKENFDKVRGYILELSDDQQASIRAGVEQGGIIAEATLDYVIKKYNSEDRTTIGANMEDTGATQQEEVQEISAREFAKEYKIAVQNSDINKVNQLRAGRANARRMRAEMDEG